MKDYPPPKKKKKKVLDHYLHHDLGMLPLLRCFFAHLLILQYPDHHQNLISSYLYYSGPVHKISSQSVHNFLSNVVHRQTNRQTDRQTNATKNITSFAKEVIKSPRILILVVFLSQHPDSPPYDPMNIICRCAPILAKKCHWFMYDMTIYCFVL